MIQRLKRTYLLRLIQAYGNSQAGNFAGSIAFTMFLSMFPLILGVLSLIALFLTSPGQQQAIDNAIVHFFPSDAHSAILQTLQGVRHNRGIIGGIGIVGMLWGGSSIFTTMEWVLDQLFGVKQRSFLKQRLMALVMTVIFTVAILLTVLLNSAFAVVKVAPWTGPVIGAVVWIGFMATIYRVVPHRTFRLAELWRGALLAGVAMEVISLLWPVYTHFSHGFSSYGSEFALFFLLATWLYFLSQLILLGAVANRVAMGPPTTVGAVPDRPPTPQRTAPADAVDAQTKKRAAV